MTNSKRITGEHLSSARTATDPWSGVCQPIGTKSSLVPLKTSWTKSASELDYGSVNWPICWKSQSQSLSRYYATDSMTKFTPRYNSSETPSELRWASGVIKRTAAFCVTGPTAYSRASSSWMSSCARRSPNYWSVPLPENTQHVNVPFGHNRSRSKPQPSKLSPTLPHTSRKSLSRSSGTIVQRDPLPHILRSGTTTGLSVDRQPRPFSTRFNFLPGLPALAVHLTSYQLPAKLRAQLTRPTSRRANQSSRSRPNRTTHPPR